jgi:hypothetical protein
MQIDLTDEEILITCALLYRAHRLIRNGMPALVDEKHRELVRSALNKLLAA